jgi:DNA primase
MTAKVLLMPEGEDPDTFLRKYGNERFRRSLGAAISPIQFIMKSFGKNKLDGVRYALMLLAPCPDALLREDVLRELSERSNISEMVLHEELGTLGKRYSRTDMRQSAVKKNDQQEALINQEELILLNITLSMPEKAYAIINLIGHDGIETPILKRIFQKIMQVSDEGIDRVHFVKELLQRCEEDETSLITRLLLRPEIDLSSAEDNIAGCLRKIFLRRIDGEIRSAEQQGEVQRLQALLKEKASLLIQPTTRKLNT